MESTIVNYTSVGWGVVNKPDGAALLVFQIEPNKQLHFPLDEDTRKKMGNDLMAPRLQTASLADVHELTSRR